ncbi:MAG TPA: hypothetical protein VFV11_03340 [Solimonas sp.]|nr:hypothetical protein [Solimonas sp.]
MIRVLALSLLSLMLGACAVTGAHPADPARAQYLAALADVESATTPVSLEPLLARAEALQDTLMSFERYGDQAQLETYDEARYSALQAELRGLRLSRGTDVYAQPDPEVFLALAEAKGREADRAFFRLYRDYWTAELLPRYLKVGQRPTPCVRFGDDVLAPLYAGWRDYAARYPQAYVAFTRQTLADLEEAVSLGVCTCDGDENTVRAELTGFLARFPQTPVAAQIGARVKELDEDPYRRPVHCR